MSETLLANLFFIITGAAILAVGAFACFVLYRLFTILGVVRTILERVEQGTELLVEDVRTLRENIIKGSIAGRILTAVMSAVGNIKPKRRTSRKKETAEDQSE